MRTISALAAALALPLVLAACHKPVTPGEKATPSGLPVPRYVSLKFDRVYARTGPSEDNRVLWVYTAKGLPVQVIEETSEWRKVCDPDGGAAWVHKRTTAGGRSVMNTGVQAVTLYKKPRVGAEVAAYLNPRALASLLGCKKGWCRVRAGGHDGWVQDGSLWGTADGVQCK